MIGRFIYAAAFTLFATVAAQACPDPSAMGERHDETGKGLYSEKTYQVRAGGGNDLDDCRNVRPQSDKGSGYVTDDPDFSFNLRGMSGYKLDVEVESECDSVLLINTGTSTWYYDDDDNGNLDARIELSRPADGWLDVWVGTHDGDYCDATLSLETF